MFRLVAHRCELSSLTTVNIGNSTLKINLISLVTHFQKLTDRASQGTNIVVHCSIWQEVPNQTQILNVISFNMCLEPRLPFKKKFNFTPKKLNCESDGGTEWLPFLSVIAVEYCLQPKGRYV